MVNEIRRKLSTESKKKEKKKEETTTKLDLTEIELRAYLVESPR